MGNFETIVRPVVFPNIRPLAPRPVAPESDPEKGLARINGQGGSILSLPFNYTVSMSCQKQKELKRRVDQVRVYQKEDDGTVNKDNFIDIEVTNTMWLAESGASGNRSADKVIPIKFKPVEEKDNIEILKKDVIHKSSDPEPPVSVAPIEEAPIEP